MTAIAGRRVVLRFSRRHVAVWLVAAALLTAGSWQLAGRDVGDAGVSQASLEAFTAEIERLGAEGGQIVVDGMKPGVADIAERALPDAVLARMAAGWVASMREVQRELLAVDAPGDLAAVAVRFERALVMYVRTGETLVAAAYASGEHREDLIDEAVASGTEADRLYEDAMRALAAFEVGR